MITEVYIGNVKSDKFDYDVAGDWNGYAPEPLCELQFMYVLYWDIVHYVIEKRPNTKQTDWGCFVMKMSKAEMINYLNKDKYWQRPECFPYMEKEAYEKKSLQELDYLLSFVNGLSNDEEYLLVAIEGIDEIE